MFLIQKSGRYWIKIFKSTILKADTYTNNDIYLSFGTRSFASKVFSPSFEHVQLRETVRIFAEKEVEPFALQFDREEKFNFNLFKKCAELGLLGISVSENYGGSSMDSTAILIVHEEIGASDPGFALSFLAHSILFTHNLYINGNDEQKARFLPRACDGSIFCGMGMSESFAGTDVLGMKSVAKSSPCGKGFILNGSKMWITNGTVNDIETGDAYLVYARTGNKPRDLSMFIVEKGMSGFYLGQKIRNKCGMRTSPTGELLFDNVFIPKENIVGAENGSIACMVKNLEIERLALAGISLGIARRSVEIMNRYAKDRISFGKPINSFGQIQRHIAESYSDYMAARSFAYVVASNLDMVSSGNGLNTDAVKLFASTIAKNVADKAIQVLGGNGYINDYHVEKLWRDSKLIEIGGGTLEAHHKNIVRDLQKLKNLP